MLVSFFSSIWIRLALRLCKKTSYKIFDLYSLSGDDSFFSVTIQALDTLAIIDPRRFLRVQKYIRKIAHIKSGISSYYHPLSVFIVHDFSKDDIVLYASNIVHEGTHGYLDSKGFQYTFKTREQIERICLKEQFRFIKKAIFFQDHLTHERKEEIWSEWKKGFSQALETRWWETHHLIADGIKSLIPKNK